MMEDEKREGGGKRSYGGRAAVRFIFLSIFAGKMEKKNKTKKDSWG